MIPDAIQAALAAQAQGRPVPEAMADEATAEAIALAHLQLQRAGLAEDAIDALFDQPFEVVLANNPQAGCVDVTIEFQPAAQLPPIIRA